MTPANGPFLELTIRRNRPQRCSGHHEYDTKLSHPHGEREIAMGMGKFGVVLVVAGATLWTVPANGQFQERTIRWGHLNNTDHPVSLGVQKFAEVLAAKSGGKLKIREFAASQLGNEMQQQSAVRGGTQEVLSASTTSLASVVKDLGLFDFPFIVGSFEQAEALAL